jgi:hypothetical protein
MSPIGMNVDHLSAFVVPRADRTDKIMVGCVVFIFVVLAAFTSGLPDRGPLSKENDPMQEDLNNGDAAWVLTASAMVLIMTPGLSFFYGGMVDHKNIISTMYQRLEIHYFLIRILMAERKSFREHFVIH